MSVTVVSTGESPVWVEGAGKAAGEQTAVTISGITLTLPLLEDQESKSLLKVKQPEPRPHTSGGHSLPQILKQNKCAWHSHTATRRLTVMNTVTNLQGKQRLGMEMIPPKIRGAERTPRLRNKPGGHTN